MTVVALLGPGSELQRQFAVGAAEAGCQVALASLLPERQQDFAVNSIANELWTLDADHFVRIHDATDPVAVAAFADEVVDRYAACDIAAFLSPPAPAVEADELSADELLPLLNVHVNAPFLATQAFGRIMCRQRKGTILLVMPHKEGLPAAIFGGALKGLASNTSRAWGNHGVWVDCVGPESAMKRFISALVVH